MAEKRKRDDRRVHFYPWPMIRTTWGAHEYDRSQTERQGLTTHDYIEWYVYKRDEMRLYPGNKPALAFIDPGTRLLWDFVFPSTAQIPPRSD
jgi:hypothetical protein